MGRLEGKIAIVTGAAQGMGEAHAVAFVGEGAKVMLTDINEAGGKAVADRLGGAACFMRHDVRSEEAWRDVVDGTTARFGPVTILINNAGVIGPVADIADFPPEQFLDVCAINQLGVYLGMRAVVPSMIAAGGGSIVNVSSIAGMTGMKESANYAYTASKFAVRGMSKLAAARLGAHGIRVNSVHPGYIKTPMMVAATDEAGGGAAARIPLGRFAEPEEVARLMVFLASDDSSYVSGTEQVIDGAMLAG